MLTAARPGGIVETIDGLSLVNIDPTRAVAPSADHIIWSRIGWPYQPADLVRAVEADRAIFEWAGFYRPMADLPLLRPVMNAWPRSRDRREWLEANDRFRRDVVDRLRAEGPLRGTDIPDTSAVSWTSTGWTNERNVTQMLEFLALRGEVAVSWREGRDRVWDIADRVYPAGGEVYTAEEAAALRAERRLGYLGVARQKSPRQPVEPFDVGPVGQEASIDGVSGSWRVDAGLLDVLEEFEPRTALLSPFDRLVFDRERARDLFSFEYIVEMYKPADKRRWGFFALPILHGDRLIGKLDASADRRRGEFRVTAVHEDEAFTPDAVDAVHAEIRELAAWLGLDPVGIPAA